MKCEKAQQLLLGTKDATAGSQISEAIDHARQCQACSELLSFDDRLAQALEFQPAVSPRVLANIRQAIAGPKARRSWIHSDRRSTIMQRIALSAASTALVIAATIGLLPRTAKASDPKKEFLSMKQAVLTRVVVAKPGGAPNATVRYLKSQRGAGTNTGIQYYKLGSPKDLASYAFLRWSVTDGKLVGTPANIEGSIESNQAAATAQLVRAQRNVAEAQSKMMIDLDEHNYQSISFGNAAHTLVLTPKSNAGERYIVLIDSKSKMPQKVRLEQSKNGGWQVVRQSNVSFAPKP